MSFFVLALAVCFAAYAALFCIAYFFGEKIAYPAPKSFYKEGDIKELFFIGGKMAALYLPGNNAKYTLLYSHGNGEDIGEIYPLLKKYAENGFNVLAYDYSGYGLSSGRPSERAVYSNADAVYEYAQKVLKISPKNIVLAGFSMGSAPTSYLAEKHSKELAGVVIMGGFASGIRTVLPFNILPFDLLENIKRVPRIDKNCKVLFIHGTKDRIVPYRNGLLMFEKSGGKKRFVCIKGAAHLNLFDFDSQLFWNSINDFKNSL